MAPDDFPTNRGGLCAKGWSATELLAHPERLTRPLVRAVPGDRTSPLVPTSWDEALGRLVAAIRRTQAEHGRDAVGCFGGGGLTNEQAYQFGKFARVALRTSAIDYNGRFCMSSAAGAAVRAFGLDRGLPFPLSDLAEADVLVLVGANPAETMPPGLQYLEAGRSRGALHVVVDPRLTPTARQAGLHLQALPGTDLALANGLLHLAVAEGLVDEDYVASRTSGFDAVRAAVAAYWPDRVERITGVPVAQLRRTVHALARAERAIVLTARGAEQHRSGTDTVQAWINLSLALGLPGRPGSGWGTITGQGNGQGGREHGQKADQLPGYRSLTDPAARAHVAGVWGVDPDDLPQPGRSAFEMLDALGTDGGVRTLLVLASNVAVSAPDARRVIRRLGALDFLAVSDFFLSETAALADVVLPSAMWAEEDGTMTNLEGRVLRRRRALDPPDEVRDDLRLLAELAGLLGSGHLFSSDPRDGVRRAGARLRRWQRRLLRHLLRAHRRRAGRVLAVPRRAGRRRGAPRDPAAVHRALRHARRAGPLPRRRARRRRGAARRPLPLRADHGPSAGAVPVGGADPAHAQPAAARAHPPARSCTPTSPRRLGVESGDAVELATRRGRARFTATVTDTIRPDVVFAPFHWGGESSANALTDPALDPLSRMPAFKTCAVRVTRVAPGEDGAADVPAAATPADAVPATSGPGRARVLGGSRRARPASPARRRAGGRPAPPGGGRQRHGRRPVRRGGAAAGHRRATTGSPSSGRSGTATTTGSCSRRCSPGSGPRTTSSSTTTTGTPTGA